MAPPRGEAERLQETLAKEMALSRVLSIELAELVVRAEAVSGRGGEGAISQSCTDEYKFGENKLAALAALVREMIDRHGLRGTEEVVRKHFQGEPGY